MFHHLSDEVHLWKLIRDDYGNIKTWALVDANPAALKIWGKKKETIIGKTTDQIFGEGASEQFMPIVKQIIETQQPHAWVEYFEPTNQYLSMSSIPMGEYFLSRGKDITEEKQAEIELKESRELLHRTEEISDQGSWKYDIENDQWSFSENWFKVFGVKKIANGDDLTKLVDPRDIDAVSSAFEKAINGKEEFHMEHRILGAFGQTRWVKVIAELIRSDDGIPISLIGATRDITEEKLAQKAIKDSEDLLKRTQDIAQVGGWELYPQEEKFSISKSTRKIMEIAEDHKFNFKNIFDLYHPDDRAMASQHVKEAIEEGKPYTFEARFITAKGNHKWVSTKGIPEMHDGKCVRLSGFFRI